MWYIFCLKGSPLFPPLLSHYPTAPIFRKIIRLAERREDSFIYFEEVSRILQGLDVGVWPPVELQWLFIAAWNMVRDSWITFLE
jgi:hypothetical protein